MELNKNEKKKLNDDLKKIEKRLVSDPHNSKLLYEKGVILEKLGNYHSAYTAYSMAHTYNPEMVIASDKMIVIEPKLDEIRKNEYKSLGEFLDRKKRSEKSPERPSSFEHSKKSWLSDYITENDIRSNKPRKRNFNRRFYPGRRRRLRSLIYIIIIIAIIGIAIWYMFPATTFIETGLPNGAQWTISYGQGSITTYSLATTTSKSITVYLFRFNGAYAYATSTVTASGEYCYTTLLGVFNAGTNVRIPYTCYNNSI
ncbi:MAG: hypothetical protein M1433_02305 [Candidatus Parvarchaeota archaeon]|nr:hypothetical protein [Candidatus Parvarchaeota archaeon]